MLDSQSINEQYSILAVQCTVYCITLVENGNNKDVPGVKVSFYLNKQSLFGMIDRQKGGHTTAQILHAFFGALESTEAKTLLKVKGASTKDNTDSHQDFTFMMS